MYENIFTNICDDREGPPTILDLIGKIEFISVFPTWSGTVTDYFRLCGAFATNLNIILDFFDVIGDRPRSFGIFTM